jgi:hypothetical protein
MGAKRTTPPMTKASFSLSLRTFHLFSVGVVPETQEKIVVGMQLK